MLRIGNSNKIHVFLPKDQHGPLDTILKMLEEDAGAETANSELAGYSIAPFVASPQQLWQLRRLGRGMNLQIPGGTNPYENLQAVGKEIIELLKKSFPAAVVSDTPAARTIMVLASKADQEKIRKFFEQLKQQPAPEDVMTAKMYKFSDPAKKMNDETLKQFQAVIPTATFTLDEERGQILVVATAKEQEMLAQAVTELEAAAMPEPDKIIASYKMSALLAERFNSLLRQMNDRDELEGIFVLRDPRQGLVTVWATAKQHELIGRLYEEVTGRKQQAQAAMSDPDNATNEPVLVTYPMLRGYAATAQQVLSSLIAGAEFSSDARTNAVIAVAPPELQNVIAKAVEELDKGVAEDIAFISLKTTLSDSLLRQFYRVAPRSIVVQSRRNLKVIATGPKLEIEKIKAILAESEAIVETKEEIVVHPLQTAAPSTVIAVLNEVFPEVRATVNASGNQLVLSMTAEMKEPVLSLLAQLDGSLEFMPVTKTPSAPLLQSIRAVAPRATVIVDTENSQIMLQGAAADIEKIKKIIAQAETTVPEEVLVHTLKHVASTTVLGILQEMYPDISVRDDAENDRLIIRLRPEQKDPVATLLARLDAADPDREKRFFKSYPLDTGFYSIRANWSRYRPVEFIGDLEKLVPKAKLSFDEDSQQIIVWGTEEEHKIIGEALGNLSDDGKEKSFGRFPLRRIPEYILIAAIHRLYPTVIPSYDWRSQSLIVEGHPRILQKITELIETLDPVEQTEHDPTVCFYALNAEPTPVLLQGLWRLVPTAMIVGDEEAKQLMVVAKPAEQKIIEANVKTIVSTFTAPEEPMLFIYPATPRHRERLEAFVKTAAADLKGVAIVPDKATDQVSVWAKPSEHKLIAEILKQMESSQENEPLRKLAVFQMSIGDLETAQEVMAVSHPDATVFADTQGNRLLVWATETELQKVQTTLDTQGSLDSRTMVAYPVAGAEPETLVKVINDVFTGLKITPEPQTRRILVWASPDEHVQVAEIVEQTNKKEDPNSELAEKFVAYSSAGLDPTTITPLFKALIPNADVYADTSADKITVRARMREHEQIKDLFEQLRQKDEKLRPVLVVYPTGETSPVMLEAMLRAQLQNAESLTSDEIVIQLGYRYYYERMPWSQNYYDNQGAKKVGYYKVDPETQSVHVFVSGDDQADVAKAIEQLVAVGNQLDFQPTVRRYSLDEMSVWDIYDLLYKIAPSGNFQFIYNYTPSTSDDDWYAGYRASYRDFLAYTRESEHEKIDALVREMNDKVGSGKKEMLSILVPENSGFARDLVVTTIKKMFPDSSPMPGGAPNQILVWATKQRLEKVRQMVDEVCQPLPDAQKTVLKSYPLQYVRVEDARDWLKAICPNASFDPTLTEEQQTQQRRFRQNVVGETKILHVLATPLEHLEIEKAIRELDRDLPAAQKPTPRSYALSDYPPSTFNPLYRSIIQAFPNAVVTIGAEQQSIMVVAAEDDHKQIVTFLAAYREDRESKRESLEVYSLKKLNYYKVVPLLQRIAPPPAQIFAGSKPEQVAVWATPRDHEDIAVALTKLETAAVETDYNKLRVYKVDDKKAYTASWVLSHQFPGALLFPTSVNEILVWGSDADQEGVAKMLGVVAEAFPEPVLKTYYFKHIPIGEAFAALNLMYANQATMSVRQSSGDLLVQASPEIHARIAKNVAEIDVPRPAGAEAIPVPHDLGDLPAWQVGSVATLIRQAFPGQAIVFPSSVPGQIVVLAKAAEQDKIRTMVERMVAERPETAGRMEAYVIHRGTVMNLQQTLLAIVPNIRFGLGLNPNQLLVWAREADHVKIKNIVDKLNEPETDMATEAYSLKNIYSTGALAHIRSLAQTLGLDLKTLSYDYYSNQLLVTARADDHKLIKETLDKLRADDRVMKPFQLENIDPMTAYYAINTLFADEPYSVAPDAWPDQNTNMVFVQGTPEQIEKVRKMLLDMGEAQLQTSPSEAGPQEDGIHDAAANRGPIRSMTIRGDAAETIKQLEKLWPQYKRNQLRVIRQDEMIDTEKKSSGGSFSISEPENPKNTKSDPAPTDEPATESPDLSPEQIKERVKNLVGGDRVPGNDPVYVIVNEDGSLTVTSHDSDALDQVEKLVRRIDDRVMFEGRDFTLYAVRNVSADLVATRIQMVLRDRLMGMQRPVPGFAGMAPQRLEIQADVPNSTITVRGPKFERREVANLIAMFDVSELPGGSATLKPIKVPIKNVQASRVLQQVMSVYQQRLTGIRLPGGGTPRVTVDQVTNSIELIVPEPLATELKEYALEMDRMIQDEPARKIHVIPLQVKSTVIDSTIRRIQQSYGLSVYPYNYAMPYSNMPYATQYAVPAPTPYAVPVMQQRRF